VDRVGADRPVHDDQHLAHRLRVGSSEGEANTGADTALSCSESGVLAPLVGVIGSLQAMEALKILSGYGEPLRGMLLVIDLRTIEFRELLLPVRADWPDCAQMHG